MRYYERGNKKYCSVTSLISKLFPFNKESFKRWCEENGYRPSDVTTLSSSIGTKVSSWINNRVRDTEFLDPPIVGKNEEGLYKGVQDFMDKYEILKAEETVYCDEYLYAGTYDGLVKYKDKEYLMDWKTYGAWRGNYKRSSSKIRKVKYQLSMYRYALQRELPLAVVVFQVDGSYEIEELDYTDEWIDKLFKEDKCQDQEQL
jgi:hypothetical protein